MSKLEERILMTQKAKLIVPKIINLLAEEGATVEEAILTLSITSGRVTAPVDLAQEKARKTIVCSVES
ncbi:MAG: hypothetical protein H6Q69_1324 [Firmicutes bacterium]|nr:hypothetical protein [Bacillota bacterium]